MGGIVSVAELGGDVSAKDLDVVLSAGDGYGNLFDAAAVRVSSKISPEFAEAFTELWKGSAESVESHQDDTAKDAIFNDNLAKLSSIMTVGGKGGASVEDFACFANSGDAPLAAVGKSRVQSLLRLFAAQARNLDTGSEGATQDDASKNRFMDIASNAVAPTSVGRAARRDGEAMAIEAMAACLTVAEALGHSANPALFLSMSEAILQNSADASGEGRSKSAVLFSRAESVLDSAASSPELKSAALALMLSAAVLDGSLQAVLQVVAHLDNRKGVLPAQSMRLLQNLYSGQANSRKEKSSAAPLLGVPSPLQVVDSFGVAFSQESGGGGAVSLACDGRFLYALDGAAGVIRKCGTGLFDTTAGEVLLCNAELGPERFTALAVVGGKLYLRSSAGVFAASTETLVVDGDLCVDLVAAKAAAPASDEEGVIREFVCAEGKDVDVRSLPHTSMTVVSASLKGVDSTEEAARCLEDGGTRLRLRSGKGPALTPDILTKYMLGGSFHPDTIAFDMSDFLLSSDLSEAAVRVTAISVSYGDYIHKVEVKYAGDKDGPGFLGGAESGASTITLELEEDEAVSSLQGGFGDLVDWLVIKTSKGRDLRCGGQGGNTLEEFFIPEGKKFAGFFGGHGPASMVHNIGVLLVSDAPAIAASGAFDRVTVRISEKLAEEAEEAGAGGEALARLMASDGKSALVVLERSVARPPKTVLDVLEPLRDIVLLSSYIHEENFCQCECIQDIRPFWLGCLSDPVTQVITKDTPAVGFVKNFTLPFFFNENSFAPLSSYRLFEEGGSNDPVVQTILQALFACHSKMPTKKRLWVNFSVRGGAPLTVSYPCRSVVDLRDIVRVASDHLSGREVRLHARLVDPATKQSAAFLLPSGGDVAAAATANTTMFFNGRQLVVQLRCGPSAYSALTWDLGQQQGQAVFVGTRVTHFSTASGDPGAALPAALAYDSHNNFIWALDPVNSVVQRWRNAGLPPSGYEAGPASAALAGGWRGTAASGDARAFAALLLAESESQSDPRRQAVLVQVNPPLCFSLSGSNILSNMQTRAHTQTHTHPLNTSSHALRPSWRRAAPPSVLRSTRAARQPTRRPDSKSSSPRGSAAARSRVKTAT